MRIVVVLLSVMFSVYVAIQAYIIAEVGVSYQVAQLEGDGGGGLVFALLCLASGLLAFVKPLISVVTFLVAAALSLVISLTYSDNMMIVWAVAAVILSVANLYLYRSGRKKSKANRTRAVAK